jgi:Ca2+/H+ antiporter, TMEM165/GDT1 family
MVRTMHALVISTLVVTLGEIGDKTQLLSLLLAARFQRPVPIIAGILSATLANHLLAGFVGEWVRSTLSPDVLRLILGGSFLLLAAWTLVPDPMEDSRPSQERYSVFLVTLLTFFLAEMGDKTQVATVMLAAKYHQLGLVVAGTTLGMMIADVPAVLLGKVAALKIPFKMVRIIAAVLFALLGLGVFLGLGSFE